MYADTTEKLQSVLDGAKIGFDLQRVGWREAGSWKIHDGMLSHASGGFFSVAGVEFPDTPQHDGVFLYQPQSAITGLLTTRINGEVCALLQARVEPGTLGTAQFGPTVQSTPANYQKLHGGRSTPYFEHFSTGMLSAHPYSDTTQLDLGERYWMKSKRLILAQCSPELPVTHNYVWATPAALQQGVLRDAFFNIDLRSLLALMPWDSGHLAPRSNQVSRSLAREVRAGVLGHLFAAMKGRPRTANFVPIDQLKNWHKSDTGLKEWHEHQGFGVDFFEVQALGREVDHWVQPMVVTGTPGRAVLLCRLRGKHLEVLVTLGSETGLQTGSALLPSSLRYPGCISEVGTPGKACDAMTPIASTMESDEGGRFYQSVSRYELRWCEDTPPCSEGKHQSWITIAELRVMLAISNCCAIQLRGLASMLLGSAFS